MVVLVPDHHDGGVSKVLGKLVGICSLLISGMLAPGTWAGK